MKKTKKIIKAFLKEEPISEKWYQDRLAICETCPLNSKNIDDSKLSMQYKLTLAAPGCGGSVCVACGCCIRKKATLKEEVCGRIEIGENPLWKALESKSTIDPNVNVINIEYDKVEMENDGKAISFLLEATHKDKVLDFTFAIKKKKKFDYKNYSACSCTTLKHEDIGDDTSKFSVRVSLTSFKTIGTHTKSMVIYYFDKGKEKKISFKLKINKKS